MTLIKAITNETLCKMSFSIILLDAKGCYDECHITLSVVMLTFVMLGAKAPYSELKKYSKFFANSHLRLRQNTQHNNTLWWVSFMQSVVFFIVVMCAILLNVIMLSVIVHCAIMLTVGCPECHYADSWLSRVSLCSKSLCWMSLC
jgi:hypothetical protein